MLPNNIFYTHRSYSKEVSESKNPLFLIYFIQLLIIYFHKLIIFLLLNWHKYFKGQAPVVHKLTNCYNR